VIILDLRLGESWGLDALQDLRSAGVSAPVMILTAYGETESALQAGQLGAVAYHHKPLVGKNLLHAVRDAAATVSAPAPRPSSELPRPGGIVSRILDDIEHLGDDASLAGRLAQALADPTLTLFEFLALSTCLRTVRKGVSPSLSPAARQLIGSAAQLRWEDVGDLVRRVVTTIEGAGNRWRFLRRDSVAADSGTDAATLRRVLHDSMGLTFQSLIRAIVFRRAIGGLAASEDDIRQVAYGLGYEHRTSFNRDFKEHFGMSPSELRALLAATGGVTD
jgi:AraC-like DNA-binding protein